MPDEDDSKLEGSGESEEKDDDPKDKAGFGKEYKPAKQYELKDGKWEKKAPEEPERKVTIYQHTWANKEGYIGGLDKEVKGKSEFAEGKASIGLFHGEAKATSELSWDLDKKEANLTVINAEAAISVVHGEADGKFKLGKWVKSLFSDDDPKPVPPPTPGIMGIPMLMAARVGDLTSHGSPLAPGIGSSNVIIGDMPAWRTELDFHACPIVKGVVPDVGGVVMMGSPTVFINYMMACRVMDMVVEIPGGPNPVAMGCPTVFIGGGGAAPVGGEDSGKKEDDNDLTVQGKAEGDIGTAKAEVDVGVVVDKEKVQAEAKGEAMAAVAKGSVEGGITIPIPWTSHSVTLGGSAEGYAVGAGIEGHAEAGWTKEKGYHAGAGVGAALGFGGGVNFSIGFK